MDSGINKTTPGRVVTSVAVPGRDGDGSDVAALEQFDHAFSQVPDRHKCLVELAPSHRARGFDRYVQIVDWTLPARSDGALRILPLSKKDRRSLKPVLTTASAQCTSIPPAELCAATPPAVPSCDSQFWHELISPTVNTIVLKSREIRSI